MNKTRSTLSTVVVQDGISGLGSCSFSRNASRHNVTSRHDVQKGLC